MENKALIEAAKNAQALNEPIHVTKENAFNASFDRYACEGDSISAIVDGYTITATIKRDDSGDKPDQRDDGFWPSMQPENAGYLGTIPREEYEKALARANEVMEAWKKDEWFFCGIVLSVAREGVMIEDHAASLWGIECNYPKNPDAASPAEDYPNNYLTETANELLDEALTEAKRVFTKLCGGRIIVTLEGGIIQHVDNIPPGVTVEIRDFDVEGTGLLDEYYKRDTGGNRYIEAVYEGGAA